MKKKHGLTLNEGVPMNLTQNAQVSNWARKLYGAQ